MSSFLGSLTPDRYLGSLGATFRKGVSPAPGDAGADGPRQMAPTQIKLRH